MSMLERYEIDQSTGRIAIALNQKKNAIVNMVISLGIIAFVAYQLMGSNDPSSFYYVLLGIGGLWFLGAIAGFRQKRKYVLTRQRIEYHSSGRSKTDKLSASDLSHLLIQKKVRPTGGRKQKIPFRWRLKLIDSDGKEFKGDFRLQEEEPARKLASVIADFYGVEIKKEET